MIRILYAVEADLSAKSGDSMSAICGIIHFDGKPIDKADLAIMAESSPHRGPDGASFHVDGNAGFAHLAFHVTPESVYGEQPLISENGRFTLVADVRLDNRAELIRKLGEDTARKKPSQLADSELLMAAFVRWGEQCLDHLLGDFVFAVWNREKQELFLARDALGGYSVTWHQSGQTLLFASETAAILDFPAVRPEIDQDAVVKTLAALPLRADETHFESIHYLPPGHCMLVSTRKNRLWRYWDIDPDTVVTYRSDDEYTDHFLDLLEQSVACRIRSTGPVGLSLSGGYDSTLLAAVAARQRSDPGQQLHSFSYVFDRLAESDERQYIKPVVDQYGIDAQYIVADDLWSFADLTEQAIPLDHLWTNCFASLPAAVTQSAGRQGCRVLLTGSFGDALFSEPSLFAADLLRQGRLRTLYRLARRYPHLIEWKRDLVQHGVRQLLPLWLRRTYRYLYPNSNGDTTSFLSASWSERVSELSRNTSSNRVHPNLSPGRQSRYRRIFDTAWAHGYAATRGHLYNRNGLEPGEPYFDRRLVEFVMSIPTEQLSHPGRPRKLQNEAMRRLLPDSVWQRSGKTSFEPLFWIGLLEKEKKEIKRLIQSPEVVKQGFVKHKWLTTQLEQGRRSPEVGSFISLALHTEQWLKAIRPALAGRSKWSEPGHWR